VGLFFVVPTPAAKMEERNDSNISGLFFCSLSLWRKGSGYFVAVLFEGGGFDSMK